MNSISDIIIKMKENDKKGISFHDNAGEFEFLSYKELFNTSLKLLSIIQKQGIKKGDKVIFQLEDNKTMVLYLWACILGGVIPVPLTMGNTNEQINKLESIYRVFDGCRIITNSKHKNLIKVKYNTENLDEIYEEILNQMLLVDDIVISSEEYGVLNPGSGDDAALIQFSSGSSDMAKGVILSHSGIIVNLEDITQRSNMTALESMQSWLPLTHDMGLIAFHLLPCFNQMNSMIMKTSLFMNNPIQWIEACSQYKSIYIASPNFGYRHFLSKYDISKNYGWDLSSVKVIYNGAEPVDVDLANEFMNKLSPYGLNKLTMYPAYGLAEACVAVTIPNLGSPIKYLVLDRKKVSVGNEISILDEDNNEGVKFVNNGIPLNRTKVHILDNNRRELGEKRIGYVYVSGGNVTRGYYNNPSYTNEYVMDNGWVNTGDMGFICDGGLYITGRQKDVIIINGNNYYANDIEGILESLDLGSELEFVVSAVNNPNEFQEYMAVFVVYKGSIEDFVNMAIDLKNGLYKNSGIVAKYVIPVEESHKTSSGKKKRFKYREEFLDGKYHDIIQELEKISQERNLEFLQETSRNHIQEVDEDNSDYIDKQIVQIIKEELNLSELNENDNLINLGITSLNISTIRERINLTLYKDIKVSELYELPTTKAIINFIKGDEKLTVTKERKELLLTNEMVEKIKQRSKEIGVSCGDLLYGGYIYVQMFLKNINRIKTQINHSTSENSERMIALDNIKDEQALFTSIANQLNDKGEEIEELICDDISCKVCFELDKQRIDFYFDCNLEEAYINNFMINYKKVIQVG